MTVTHPDPAPPTTPAPGLNDLKQRLNIPPTQTASDAQLTWVLSVATAWVDHRVYGEPDQVPGSRHHEVVEAILLVASRLYARRNTPEGVAGWSEIGVTSIMRDDPDVSRLLERHERYSDTGFA